MNRTLKRLLSTAAALALMGVGLTGCASTPTDLQPGTAARLQERLQSLARSAADKDIPAAGTELDLLASDVSTAAANGELSAGRRQDIQNAIDLIRADLAAMTTPPTPAPTPARTLQAPPSPAPQPPGNSKGKGKDK